MYIDKVHGLVGLQQEIVWDEPTSSSFSDENYNYGCVTPRLCCKCVNDISLSRINSLERIVLPSNENFTLWNAITVRDLVKRFKGRQREE